ncbi:hypothetical protein ACWCQM_33570 [Streptomyces sp. NPDC002125]
MYSSIGGTPGAGFTGVRPFTWQTPRPSACDDYRRVLRDMRANRNRPGGFWVAKDDPGAAEEAITGSCQVSGLSAAALLSNGAGRIVDLFGLTDWPGVMATLASGGSSDIIRRVRRAEDRRAVAADDATITYCTCLGPA